MGVWGSKINLKSRRVIVEGSGRADSKAENSVERSEEVDHGGKQESWTSPGGSEKRSPEVVLPFSKTGWHINSAKPHSSRDKGVAGSKKSLECQWMVRMSLVTAQSGAVSMGKRIHAPRRRGCFCHGNEIARGSLRWGKNAIFRASGGGKTTSNHIG